jgi:hypothetical protein
MRRTLTLVRTGLAGVAALAVLSACGGNDSSSSASSSSSSAATGSSSSSSSGAASDSAFCQQAGAVLSQLDVVGNVEDPAQLAPALQQAAGQLSKIQPPKAIATDWTNLVGAVDQLAQAASGTDFANPEAASAFLQTASQLESQLGGSSTNVETYLQDQCGIDTGGTDSAAPTS